VFIVLDRQINWGPRSEEINGAFFGADYDGGQFRRDSTNFDLALIDGKGATSISRTSLVVAHELGHWLGDLLTEGMPYGIAALPDLYRLECPYYKGFYRGDVMGPDKALGLFGLFNREWLHWNEFEDKVVGGTPLQFELTALWKLRIGDRVPRIKISSQKWLVFDLRTRGDATVSGNEKAVLYVHDVTEDRSCGVIVEPVCRIPILSGQPLPTEELAYDIKLSIVELKEGPLGPESATIRIEKLGLRNLKGVFLAMATVRPATEGASYELIQLVDLDLHVYAADGRHIGMNYGTNQYEVQIPGAVFSGPRSDSEWILVPMDMEAYFTVTVNPSSGNRTESITITLQGVTFDQEGNRQESEITFFGAGMNELPQMRLDVRLVANVPTVVMQRGETSSVVRLVGIMLIAVSAVGGILGIYIVKRRSGGRKPRIIGADESRPKIIDVREKKKSS